MKKRILLIGTGGTIASEMTDGALSPGLSARELLHFVPEVGELCSVEARELYDLDSANLTPEHWLGIARTVEESYDGFDGFVVTHGTDTMAYTAAGLSYLVQASPKPIILTGAQKPISFDTTDSKINLRDAFIAAASDYVHGVAVVFNGRVIAGTRARKTHTKSFDAFASVNYPALAQIRDGRMFRFIEPEYSERPTFYSELNTRVSLLKLIPGMDTEILRFMLDRSDGLIVESFGVGGLPESGGMHETLREAARGGKTVVLTTQVPNEGSDLAVYSTGRGLDAPGILEACDMTTECAVAKLMWILARTRDCDKVAKLFYSPVSRDILTVAAVK